MSQSGPRGAAGGDDEGEDSSLRVRFALSPLKLTPNHGNNARTDDKENQQPFAGLPSSQRLLTSRTRTYRRKSSAARRGSPASSPTAKSKGRSTSLTLVADSQPPESFRADITRPTYRADPANLVLSDSQTSSLSDVPAPADGSPKHDPASILSPSPKRSLTPKTVSLKLPKHNAQETVSQSMQKKSSSSSSRRLKSKRFKEADSAANKVSAVVNREGDLRPDLIGHDAELSKLDEVVDASKARDAENSDSEPDFGIVFSELSSKLPRARPKFDVAAFNETLRQREEADDLFERETTRQMQLFVGEWQDWLSGHSAKLAEAAAEERNVRLQRISQMERREELLRHGLSQVVSMVKQTMKDLRLDESSDQPTI